MNADRVRGALRDVAKELRPVSRSPFIPLIRLVSRYGLRVELRFYLGKTLRHAQTDLSSAQPRILIYRQGSADGCIRLDPQKEHLLTPRERFSVAHEFGHFLAFKYFDCPPVLKEAEPREYHKQEDCMDEFAESLLVPDWLTKSWLLSAPQEKPIPINHLRAWASDQCHVSSEVAARALTRVNQDIGFLKTAEGLHLTNETRLFIVFYSSHGTRLELPKLHSYIQDEKFIGRISGVSGNLRVDACRLGRVNCKNIEIEWQGSPVERERHRKEFRSTVRLTGRGYWISLRTNQTLIHQGLGQQAQLSLFN
jgi:hypothetical protein